MSARRLSVLACCAVLAGTALACGEGDPVPVRNNTIGVRLDEYRIRPESISAPAGTIRLIARNRGRLTHNVRVQTITDSPDARPEVLESTDTLHPGERDELTFTLPAGRYRLVCSIANHDDLGQYAELHVE